MRMTSRLVVAAGAVMAACICVSAAHAQVEPGVQADLDQVVQRCVRNVEQLVRGPLSNAPDFATIHEMTAWLALHQPNEISARFADAGRAVSQSLAEQERIGVIHGTFWNLQALSELLLAQSPRFGGVAGCAIPDDIGVAREILQDQLFIALALQTKPVNKTMARLGVSDPYYAKAAIFYAMILDSASVSWRDEDIARVAKFRLEPPDEAR